MQNSSYSIENVLHNSPKKLHKSYVFGFFGIGL